MDCYVVRVYRRDKNLSRRLIGIVEQVGMKEKRAFTNLEELWEILSPEKKPLTVMKDRQEKKRNPPKDY